MEEKLINPIIHVDLEEDKKEENKEELIKPYTIEEKKGPEDKIYLLLYCFISEAGESRTFEFIKGRTETRNRIIADLEVGDVDIHKSRVLVEGAPLEDSITLYSFMKHIETYFEDSFDIEDYNTGDIEDANENTIHDYVQTDVGLEEDGDPDPNVLLMLGLSEEDQNSDNNI